MIFAKNDINAYDNYDVNGYSQYVTVQTMDSRRYGNEEYQICNSCFEKILTFVADMMGKENKNIPFTSQSCPSCGNNMGERR